MPTAIQIALLTLSLREHHDLRHAGSDEIANLVDSVVDLYNDNDQDWVHESAVFTALDLWEMIIA